MLPVLLAALLAAPAAAQPRRNVLETLNAALAADRAYDAGERARLMDAIRTRFADYGLQVVDARRKDAVPVVLHVITEGSFDQAPPDRVADVAFAAYQAMSRGAPPEEVEGIALYGYRKKIPGDTIAAWANGYRQLTENKVPGPVAADLVRLAMEKDWSVSVFDTLKWALVSGVKDGFDARDYATYLFGRMVQGKAGPGTIAGDAKAVFRRARRERKRPVLPPYEGVFSPAPPPAGPNAGAPPPIVRRPPPRRGGPRPPLAPAAVTRAEESRRAKAAAAPTRGTAAETPAFAALWPGLDKTARSYLGTPYVWGGVSHSGIDCSGLTHNTYGENRVAIPRVSRDQYRVETRVPDGRLRDGDLVFFNTLGVGVSHVGMVVDAESGRFIQSSSSKGVSYALLSNRYFHARYLGARRVVP
jgi:cell wall-associated NlpC family hydrolase